MTLETPIQKKVSLHSSIRLRRLRSHSTLRQLIRDVVLVPQHFVLPLFIIAGKNIKNPIASMPGCYQFSLDQLTAEIKSIVNLNILAVMLFGIPDKKDAVGSSAWSSQGIIQQAISEIKNLAPQLLIITDLCFCEYTDHGHCGVLDASHGVDNDATLELLARQAVSHAKAGSDVIAPSGMMDGMVQAIRQGLDDEGFSQLPILSYAVKYASSFYGPFREAAQGTPQFGDRKSYQMDTANTSECLREVELDIQEGADMLMVKPAGAYLDIIYKIKQKFPAIPLAAYQVSGEYAMIKAAAQRGWLDENAVMLESLIAIKRAGANFIISY